MYRICLGWLFLLMSAAAAASDSSQALRDIDRSIWEPFLRGVNTFDHALYSGVRARDSIFVDGKRFFGYDAYVEDAVSVMTPMQQSGIRIAMQVRFEERVTDGQYASEKGVLRTVMTDASGKERVGHARFHVISRKQAEGWRIVTDYRWRTTASADAAAFEATQAP